MFIGGLVRIGCIALLPYWAGWLDAQDAVVCFVSILIGSLVAECVASKMKR